MKNTENERKTAKIKQNLLVKRAFNQFDFVVNCEKKFSPIEKRYWKELINRITKEVWLFSECTPLLLRNLFSVVLKRKTRLGAVGSKHQPGIINLIVNASKL